MKMKKKASLKITARHLRERSSNNSELDDEKVGGSSVGSTSMAASPRSTSVVNSPP